MLMDGRAVNLPVDSASTSKEICNMLSKKVKLTDTFGFSLFISLYEKVHNHIFLLCDVYNEYTNNLFFKVEIDKLWR